jgi:hypothetical protein
MIRDENAMFLTLVCRLRDLKPANILLNEDCSLKVSVGAVSSSSRST